LVLVAVDTDILLVFIDADALKTLSVGH